MRRTEEDRRDPRRVLAGAESVIVLARESAQASGVIGLEALGEKVVFRLQRPRHAVEVKVGAEERREPGEVGGEERANGDGVAGVVLRA